MTGPPVGPPSRSLASASSGIALVLGATIPTAAGVLEAVARAVAAGPALGRAVGRAVGPGVERGAGLGVGSRRAVAFGVGAGIGVGATVGAGIGLALGFGVGLGFADALASGAGVTEPPRLVDALTCRTSPVVSRPAVISETTATEVARVRSLMRMGGSVARVQLGPLPCP